MLRERPTYSDVFAWRKQESYKFYLSNAQFTEWNIFERSWQTQRTQGYTVCIFLFVSVKEKNSYSICARLASSKDK